MNKRGDSFISPEIYSDSSYSKSYSFSITLATPYGCKEAWYYNIYVYVSNYGRRNLTPFFFSPL